MSYHYLEITRGVEVGRRFALPDGALSIGRSSQNAIALNPAEKSVSSHHAIIYKSATRIMLQDMQSTNGTFVNEQQVGEKDLSPGDVVGFGKNGPRLKFIVSETELELAAAAPAASDTAPVRPSTRAKTVEDRSVSFVSRDTGASTCREEYNTITRIKQDIPPDDTFLPPSATMEMEKKILHKRLGSSDMHKLVKNGERIEKIIGRGNVDEAQANLLRTAHGAYRKSQRQWVVVLSAVVGISLVTIAYFAVRAYQYRALLNHAQSIESELDDVEKKISDAKSRPDASKNELRRLVMELEEKNAKLAAMKTKIDTDDFGEFYSDPLEKTIDGILRRFGETDYHIPEEMVERVRFHIDVYSGRMKPTIARYLIRKEKYFPMIHRIFREKNMPVELCYISMLESGFNPNALSHAGARGLWQFMKPTGQKFGLRIDDQTDERLDPEKATHAAAEYFKDLIGIFGGKSSVMLAMAAYNAGEGRIMGALRKIDNPMRNRDFWYIYRMGYLAEETNEYIPRMIAMMIISERPADYGFDAKPAATASAADLEQETDFLDFDVEDTSLE